MGCTSLERLRRFNALLSLSFSLIQARSQFTPYSQKVDSRKLSGKGADQVRSYSPPTTPNSKT